MDNDLISRSALIADMRERSYMDKALCEIFETVVDEAPTAYDVDKVMKQLNDSKYWTKSTFDEDGYSNNDEEEVVNFYEAIGIVEGGGIHE